MMPQDFFLSQQNPFAHPRGLSRSVLKVVRVKAVVLRPGMRRQWWLLLQSWMMLESPFLCWRESEIESRSKRGLRNNWP